MSVKRAVGIIFFICVSFFCFSQTQCGYVKTIGRLTNGALVSGKEVPNVTIQVKNRSAVISGEDGTFSFPMPDKTFVLQQVRKQHYVLVDPDILSQQYAYSTNPLVILMADQLEQEAYRREVERKMREKLDSDLQHRIAELQKQLEQRVITEEVYREQQIKIDKDYNDYNDRIIKDMVERFTKIDFDSADEFDRLFGDYIVGGHLDEADSLLKTKGNVWRRKEELSRLSESNTAMHQELEFRETAEKNMRVDLAEDLLKWSSLSQLNHLYDSAACYLEQRADLDSANAEWQNDAGRFLLEYLSDYERAEMYFNRSRDAHEAMGEDGKLALAEDYTNIGETYYLRRQKSKTIAYCEEALSIRRELLGDSHPLTAESYNNLGLLTDSDMVLKAINIMKEQGDTLPELAQYYENYAGLRLIPNGYYRQAMVYYLLPALEICKKYYGEDHVRTADSYNSIGNLYYMQAQYVLSKWWYDCADALDAYNNAVSIYEKVYGPNHLKVADVHLSMGETYLELSKGHLNSGNNSIAEGYAALAESEIQKSMESYQAYEDKFGITPAMMSTAEGLLTHRQFNNYGDIASSYFDLGMNHYECGNNEQALACIQAAMELCVLNNISMANGMKFCQSCGMPLTEELLGTNADGSKNEDYCIYCYKDGAFTSDCTMDEMIEFCSQHLDEINKEMPKPMTKEEYVQMMHGVFPLLKRWKNK